MKKNELIQFCKDNGIAYKEGLYLRAYDAVRVYKGNRHVEFVFFDSGELYGMWVQGISVNVDPRVRITFPRIGYGHYSIGDFRIAEPYSINLMNFKENAA